MQLAPIHEISHLIPQKFPFEMVDSLLDFSETSVTSSFTPKEGNVFLKDGEFAEEGLIENMAQTIALHKGYSYSLIGKDAPTGYIGSIKSVQIFKLPKTGETLTTQVRIIHEFMGITMVEVVVKSGETELAKGEMKTVLAG